MKRVTLGAVLRECRRRGIRFSADLQDVKKMGRAYNNVATYLGRVFETQDYKFIKHTLLKWKREDPVAYQEAVYAIKMMEKYIAKVRNDIGNTASSTLR